MSDKLDPADGCAGAAFATGRPAGPRASIGDAVGSALEHYFSALEGEPPSELYALFIAEVERPLFEAVMRCARDNQTHAASYLGISRSTLRKKLKQYGLLD